MDVAAGDLHFQALSPALDAGINSAQPPEITSDLDGFNRIANGGVDLWAYETSDCYNAIFRIWSGAIDIFLEYRYQLELWCPDDVP